MLFVLLLLAIVLFVLLLLAVVLFVLLLLAIVLFVLLRYTDSDYPFGIFKLFFEKNCNSLVFFSHLWAERLLAHIMEPRWTKHWMFKIVLGQYSDEEYNKEMNALFVKLHLLDPQTVIPAFQFLLNQRGKLYVLY